MHIDEVEITIFDTETTGLNPLSGDRVVEIAGIRYLGSQKKSSFVSLINPSCPISPGAFAINKISPEMLENAPIPLKVFPAFLEFSQGSCLCSYNAQFDMGFLNNELKLIGTTGLINNPILDVLTLARKTLPGLERYSLKFVASALDIKVEQVHRALSDVELTAGVFFKLKNILLEKGISDFLSFSKYCK